MSDQQLIEVPLVRAELVALDAHLLEQGDVEVAERGLLAAVLREEEVAAVLEAPPARMTGRFVLAWALALPMPLPNRTIV